MAHVPSPRVFEHANIFPPSQRMCTVHITLVCAEYWTYWMSELIKISFSVNATAVNVKCQAHIHHFDWANSSMLMRSIFKNLWCLMGPTSSSGCLCRHIQNAPIYHDSQVVDQNAKMLERARCFQTDCINWLVQSENPSLVLSYNQVHT